MAAGVNMKTQTRHGLLDSELSELLSDIEEIDVDPELEELTNEVSQLQQMTKRILLAKREKSELKKKLQKNLEETKSATIEVKQRLFDWHKDHRTRMREADSSRKELRAQIKSLVDFKDETRKQTEECRKKFGLTKLPVLPSPSTLPADNKNAKDTASTTLAQQSNSTTVHAWRSLSITESVFRAWLRKLDLRRLNKSGNSVSLFGTPRRARRTLFKSTGMYRCTATITMIKDGSVTMIISGHGPSGAAAGDDVMDRFERMHWFKTKW